MNFSFFNVFCCFPLCDYIIAHICANVNTFLIKR
nr:MAG TPA: hypothetical protein [Caudoviricetes sp.]